MRGIRAWEVADAQIEWDNIKVFLNNSPKTHSLYGDVLVLVICNHASNSKGIAVTLIFRLVNSCLKPCTEGTASL